MNSRTNYLYDPSLKGPGAGKRVRIDQIDEYYFYEKFLINFFLNHGTNLSALEKLTENQGNKEKDLLAGGENKKYLNRSWARPMRFTNSCTHYWETKRYYYNKTGNLLTFKNDIVPAGIDYEEELYRPAFLIFKRNDFFTLMQEGHLKGVYNTVPTHNTSDKGFIEWVLDDKSLLPDPIAAIIGSLHQAVAVRDRITEKIFKTKIIDKIEIARPNIKTIIYAPSFWVAAPARNKTRTGIYERPAISFVIMKYIFNLLISHPDYFEIDQKDLDFYINSNSKFIFNNVHNTFRSTKKSLITCGSGLPVFSNTP